MYVIVIFYQIIHGVGEELVSTALFPKNLVEHPAVAEQFVLSAGAGVELIVKILDGAGRNAHVFKIEIRIALPPRLQACQLFVKPLDLPWQRFRGHVDDHLLEGLVIVKRQDGDLFERDGVMLQHDEHGVADHSRIHRYQPPAVAETTHPKRIDRLGGNEKETVEVGDGATMRHLADHMGVAYRLKTVGRNDLTQYRHLVPKHRSVTLGKGFQDKGQQRYDEYKTFQDRWFERLRYDNSLTIG